MLGTQVPKNKILYPAITYHNVWLDERNNFFHRIKREKKKKKFQSFDVLNFDIN